MVEMPENSQDAFHRAFVLRGFTPAEFSAFYRLLEKRAFAAGDVMIQEGEPVREMYFLTEGTSKVRKQDAEASDEYSLACLLPGAVVGELALIDPAPASATVRATAPCMAFALPLERLKAHPLYPKLVRNVAAHCTGRLRSTTQQYIQRLAGQIREVRERHAFGELFIITILIAGLSNFTFDLRQHSILAGWLISWGFMALYLIPFTIWARARGMTFADVGLTTRGWLRGLLEGVGVCLVMGPLILLYRHLSAPGEPLWAGAFAARPVTVQAAEATAYLALSFSQELLARGILQGAVTRFMRDRHWLWPIVTVSFCFGVLHLHYGVVEALLTTLMGFLFGVIYDRQRSLVGVTLVHWILGLLALLLGIL